MKEVHQLLQLVKAIVSDACQKLCNVYSKQSREYTYSETVPREVKAIVDRLLEHEILERLKCTGIPILSEETGEISGQLDSDLKFLVDPLDGTMNFVRGLGPAAISIALYKDNAPVFGVLGVYPNGDMAWGGRNIGAFLNGKPIKVSAIIERKKAVLCTGFPSRFQFDNPQFATEFFQSASHYAKIRMLGAASISLLRVAQGAAEVYTEQNIMPWDVGAGLALVEGAGGVVSMEENVIDNALNIMASNGVLV